MSNLITNSMNRLVSNPWSGLNNPVSGWDTFNGFMANMVTILDFAIGFSGVVLVILLIYGGYTYILSAGDDDRVMQAQKIITNAVIGTVIVFVASMAVRFLISEIIL